LRLRYWASSLIETNRNLGLRAAVRLLRRGIWAKLPMLTYQIRSTIHKSVTKREIRAVQTTLGNGTLRIAIAITGGVGDFIVAARFLRDLIAHTGPLSFDVFSSSPARAKWVFGTISGNTNNYHDILFGQLKQEYALALRLNQFAIVYEESVKWRDVKSHDRLVGVVANLVKSRSMIDPFIDRHPYMDNFLAQVAVFYDQPRHTFLHFLAKIPYGGDRLELSVSDACLRRCNLRPRTYVTIHNGFDPGFVISGKRATKCYMQFDEVVKHLRELFPELLFVQIGAETSEVLSECDMNLIGKTTLPEAAELLQNALIHLDNESGLVHLASCLGTRAAVVFGPTPSDYFHYKSNVAIEPVVCGNCWWITRTWMDACAKGFPEPRCMTEQQPASVASAAAALISEVRGTVTKLFPTEPPALSGDLVLLQSEERAESE
jgi:Glycosyltransferase family 9 (heptosyltransferase)